MTNNPPPESFIPCPCGAILGYRAHFDGAIYFYLYKFPPNRIRDEMGKRNIVARVLFGDAYCPHCGTWVELDLKRPWEKK